MNRHKVEMKEDMQTETKEYMQTNNKSVRIDKKAANVSIQVSSERAQVAE